MAGAEFGLYAAAAEALRSRRAIPLSKPKYDEWARGKFWRGNPSTNHWNVAKVCDAANLANHRQTVLSRVEQLEGSLDYARGPLCGKEALGRSEYLDWNATGYLVHREVWAELGETEASSENRIALRSLIAHLVLGSIETVPKSLSAVEIERNGPGCFVANAPTKRHAQGMGAVTACGARCANNKTPGTAGQQPPPGAPTPWRNWDVCAAQEMVHEACNARPGTMGEALQDRGRDGLWVTAAEAEILRRARRDDPEALKIVVGWALDRRPGEPFRIVRKRRGATTLCLHGHPSSTATLYGCTAEYDTGIQRFLVCDPGGRDTGRNDDDVQEGVCGLDPGLSVATAYRVSGPPMQAVMPLPGGDVILDFENGPDRQAIYTKPWADDPAPPVPPPTPKKPSWIERMGL